MKSTRHTMLAMAAVFAAAFGVILSGCKPAASEVPEVGNSDVQKTRIVIDAFGNEVEVPEHPKRVLALSEVDLDAMLALGETPFGASAGRGQETFPRYLLDQTEGIELMGALYRPSFERVIGARPDLILCGGWMDDGVEKKLRKIAPVVRTYRVDDGWRTALQNVAAALNLQDQAEAFEQAYAERVASIQAELGDSLQQTASIIRWNPKGPAFMHADSFARKITGDLGLGIPEGQDVEGPAHSKTISFENLNLIDADWVFLGTLTGEGDAQRSFDAARSNPAFAQLKAVKSGQVVVVDGSMWTSSGGPIAALQLVEEIHGALK
ncbi:iron-siderophore ABC transporter substrate-binding protein [Pontiellaceae bacterium B12219]|nr:iron-siderophore ABC transporter substrate-binding protein [Pontiellaceae bacterium B12219]